LTDTFVDIISCEKSLSLQQTEYAAAASFLMDMAPRHWVTVTPTTRRYIKELHRYESPKTSKQGAS